MIFNFGMGEVFVAGIVVDDVVGVRGCSSGGVLEDGADANFWSLLVIQLLILYNYLPCTRTDSNPVNRMLAN